MALRDPRGTVLLATDDLAPEQSPPRECVLAALLAAEAAGADPAKAIRALADFRPLPHRMEVVSRAGGVTWIDDSKATNPGAALRALEEGSAPLLWIAGGRDKGLSFAGLAQAAAARVRTALLIGEAADKLAAELGPAVPSERVGTLEAAVARAAELARPGDVVLLAPGCASFDQFASFEERGTRFREAVAAQTREATE